MPNREKKMGLIRAGEHAPDMTEPKAGPGYMVHQPSALPAATRAQVGTVTQQARCKEQPRPARIQRPSPLPPPTATVLLHRSRPERMRSLLFACLFYLKRTAMTSNNLHRAKFTGSDWKMYMAAGACEENQSRYRQTFLSTPTRRVGSLGPGYAGLGLPAPAPAGKV